MGKFFCPSLKKDYQNCKFDKSKTNSDYADCQKRLDRLEKFVFFGIICVGLAFRKLNNEISYLKTVNEYYTARIDLLSGTVEAQGAKIDRYEQYINGVGAMIRAL